MSWDATRSVNIRWKTAIRGLGHSSPIIWGNRVFVTTAISSDPNSEFSPNGEVAGPVKGVARHIWRVYCLDKNTGRILWEQNAHEGVPKTKRHATSSHANPTPATDGKHLVAFFGSEGLYTYDYEGRLLWKQDLGMLHAGYWGDPDYDFGVGSSPILYKKLVIVQCDIQKNSFIAAFDIEDGKLIWRTARDELPSWSTPTVYEGARAELITNARNIRGYDPLTGVELWRLSGKGEHAVATPVVGHDRIFIADTINGEPFYAIRPGATGDISLKDGAVSNDYVAWTLRRGGSFFLVTPIVYGNLVYTCSMNGILACYRPETGERVYHQRLGGKGGGFIASPVAGDGGLYFTSEDGEIFAVRTGPKYELLATNQMGEVCLATPAIPEGMIFVRTQHHLYGIGEQRAQPRQ